MNFTTNKNFNNHLLKFLFVKTPLKSSEFKARSPSLKQLNITVQYDVLQCLMLHQQSDAPWLSWLMQLQMMTRNGSFQQR